MNSHQNRNVRLVPDEAFPAYSYVPGKFPHPTGSPLGHSHAKAQSRPEALDPVLWQECRQYLVGIDLFNHGYYWEAHEAWEALWHAAGRHGRIADFLKGLIALAAAGVKAREGRLAGVRGHALRAEAIFKALADSAAGPTELVPPKRAFLGLDLNLLLAASRELSDSPDRVLPRSEEAVVVVMPFRLSIELKRRK